MGSCSTKKIKKNKDSPDQVLNLQKDEKKFIRTNLRTHTLSTNHAKTAFFENEPNTCLPKQPSFKRFESPKIPTGTIKSGLFKLYTLSDGGIKFQNINDRQITTIQNNVSGVLKRVEIIIKEGEITNQFVNRVLKTPLDCDYICSINEIYQDYGYYYLLQDYCSGGPIGRNCGKFRDMQVVHILIQMITAIEHLHKKRLFHENLTKNSFHLLNETSSLFCKLVDISNVYEKVQPNAHNHHYETQKALQQLGSIAYELLEGCKPCFIQIQKEDKVNNNEEVVKEVLCFKKNICPKLKSVLNKMLKLNPKKRITLRQAKQALEEVANKSIPSEILEKPLFNLSKCKKRTYLQSVFLSFMLNKFSEEERIVLQKIFQFADEDQDSLINKNDLLKMFKLVLNYEDLHIDIDELFNKLDVNNSQAIDLQEFQAAACDVQMLLSETNLMTCFRLLQNQQGYITTQSTRKFMSIDEELFKNDIYEQLGVYQLMYSDFKQQMLEMLE